ncbi:MAG: hypothetical protein FWH18_11635 [Marinilabiliaceae bacterium]|nr:hypothetical protein [Marinilabiliaceae bacterium]
MKAYRIIFGFFMGLIIICAALRFLNIYIGISPRAIMEMTLLLMIVYQSWFISKLSKQLKNKEQQE